MSEKQHKKNKFELKWKHISVTTTTTTKNGRSHPPSSPVLTAAHAQALIADVSTLLTGSIKGVGGGGGGGGGGGEK